MRYYIDAFKNYNKKDGRATRGEYLFFVLFNCIFIFCFSFLDAMLDTYPTITTDYNEYSMKYGYFTIVYLVIQACPCICLQVRRLHDVGKSEKWWFVGCIPFFNFYMVYLYLKASDSYVNKYGAPVNINQKYRANIKVDITEHTDEEITYNKMCSNIDDNEAENGKFQKSKIRFCKFCGGRIDAQTKKCNGCGKQYFKGIKFNKFFTTVLILSLLIISSIILNIVQFIKADELTETIASQNSTISSQKNKIDLLDEKSGYYDTISKELSYGNVGYASNNFRASESVIVVDKNETNRKFTLTANWPNSGSVSVAYSGSAAKVSFDNNSWGTSTKMTVKPKTEGVTVVKFSNNVDSKTFKIIIIVTN